MAFSAHPASVNRGPCAVFDDKAKRVSVKDEAKRVLVITVNFRQDQCTLRFLSSAAELDGFASCQLLIVDNDSADNSVANIRHASSRLANVELLSCPKNSGYFGAANWALRRYLETHEAPDWVVVCNNDIVFQDSHFLIRLSKKDTCSAGVIAPCIISGLTGLDENPSIRQRPSQLRMWRYQLWLSNYRMMWFKQWLSPFVRRMRHKFHGWIAAGSRATAGAIYAPSGSFLVFSRKFFEAGAFLDDGSFLYAEEFRVAEMCRHLRLAVIHDPELRVWHSGSQSTGRMLSRSVYRHQKNGFSYAFARYRKSYPELAGIPQSATTTAEIASPSQPLSAAGEAVQ